MRKIRLGMVGGGQGAFIGAVHRIAARLDDQYELVAGALSSDPRRAMDSALELHIAADRRYSDFQHMAIEESQREDGIDAVAIVTPNHMHAPVATAFLRAGIHVICDKPLTSSLEDAIELERVAAQSNALFFLTHNYTAYPMVRQAKAMIEAGALGKLRVIQVEYPQDWLTEATEKTDNKQAQWRTDPSRSGPAGCLGDIGTHAFNLACFTSGLKLEAVSADLATFVEDRLLDDNVHAMLRFEQGVKGMLWSSQVAPGCENGLRIRLYGDKGGLIWSQEQPNQLSYAPFGQAVQTINRASNGFMSDMQSLTRIPAGHPEGYLEGFANLYTEAAACIRRVQQGADPQTVMAQSQLPTMSDGVTGMRFIDAVIRSSQQGSCWIDMER